MPPEQIEGDITYHLERFFTLASGIDHIESRSLNGVSIIRVYFQSNTNADIDAATIANLAVSDMKDLPPGTLPPVVLKSDASSLPVCLVTMNGEGMTDGNLKDIAQNFVRNQLASVPGASIPQPFGGPWRQIQFYVDPFKLEARQISPMDVVRSLEPGERHSSRRRRADRKSRLQHLFQRAVQFEGRQSVSRQDERRESGA